jgi:hypothetical protein
MSITKRTQEAKDGRHTLKGTLHTVLRGSMERKLSVLCYAFHRSPTS